MFLFMDTLPFFACAAFGSCERGAHGFTAGAGASLPTGVVVRGGMKRPCDTGAWRSTDEGEAKAPRAMVCVGGSGGRVAVVERSEGDIGAAVHRANSLAVARAGRKPRGGEGATRALEYATHKSGHTK